MTNIKLMIMQKPQAHLQTMTKEPAKFQIDRYNTVGGVPHTRYPRECTLIVFKPQKLLSSKVVKKVTKNKIVDNAKITCISTVHDNKSLQNFKWIVIKLFEELLTQGIHRLSSNALVKKCSRLSLSRIPWDSLKYFEISVPRHIRFAELRKKLFN